MNNNSNFKIMLQAMLDKAKSIANIKSDIKNIESKLPKIKVQATLDSTKTKSELNTKLKTVRPKIKVDADTTQAAKKIKKLGQQKVKPTVKPTVDTSQVVSGLKKAQKETKTLWDRFVSGAIGVNLVRMSVQKVTQAIYQAIAGIKELDKIKTDIQTASGVDDSQINSMMQSYNQIAKNLSSTTKDVGNAANEIVRMGESLSNTNKLIENSTMLAKVGMIESSQATEYLISSMKGFQISAQDSTQIIDKLTSVDMEAAVSAGGLAEAMSRCANIANNSGTSMDRLIGYMATVGEVTQDSMSVIGNSFKSMYSRMNNIKIGKFVDDETGESLSDTEAVLNKLGIQLRDTQNTYRDFDNVLDDVGNNWRNFTQVEQNAISVAIAGTMQRERFIALMNNYSNALKYSEVAANSAGSALERYGVYQDSIEAKTNELTASIESLSMNVVSEELYSGIIQATTGIVEFLDRTNLLKGTLAGLVAMGVSKAFVSISTGIMTAAKSAAQLTAAMALLDKGTSVNNLKKIGQACIGLNDAQLKLILSAKGLKYEQQKQILLNKGVAETEVDATLATLGFANAEDRATVSTFSLKGAWNSLKTAIASNKIGFAMTGIATAVSLITMVVSSYRQAQEEMIQSAKESADAYKDSSSSINDYVSKYQELREALLAAKGNEQETYNVKKQLLELQTELNEKYGDEYGAVNLVTDAYKDQTQAIKALNKESAQIFLNENKAGVDKAEKEMTKDRHYNLSYTGMVATTDKGAALKEIAEKYADQGMSILDEGDGGVTFSVHLYSDAQSAYETINAFENDVRNKAKELGNEHMFDDVLSISSNALNNAKNTIDKYGDIFKQALTAEIASDDDKAGIYGEALKAVADYNEAVLKSENLFDDEKVMTAKNNLDTIRNSIQENEEEFAKYSTLFDEVFAQADTRLLEFNEALKNDSGLQKLANDLQGMSDLDLKAFDNSSGENESFDKLKDAAKEYGLSIEELIDSLVRLEYVQGKIQNTMEKANESVVSKSAMIDSLNALSDGFDIIDKIYADVKDKDVFDFANLDTKKFQEAFGELGVEYENFIEKVSESPNDINACQQAFNELVSRYLEASGALDNLNDENAKVTASMLELMGVSNAQELVDDALLRKKAELIVATDAYKNATDEEKQAMLEEIGTGEALGQIIDQIKLQKQLANANALDTTADINAIYSLAQTAGFGAEALYNLAEARAFLMEAEAGGDVDQINEAKEAIRRIVSVEQQKLASFTADLQYTGADTSNKKSGRSGSSKSEKDLWLEEYKRKLEELKRQLNEELITQKDFYYQSESLMNEYLKDSPAHLTKYAEEISDAENTLHDEWIKTLEYEKSELEKNVSDNVLVQWQYYERLKELAEEYYNTAGTSYGKFADEYDEITREIQEGQKKLWEDVFSELNTQIDDLQSACSTVKDAVKEYSENQSLSIDTVQKLIDLEPQYLAMLLDENGQLQLNEESYARLAKAKLEEMKVDLAYQALNTINGLENEAQAVELLTGKYAELRDTSLGAVEAMLQVAVAQAHDRGEKQGQAADMMMQVYQNQKKVIDMADFSLPSLTGDNRDKDKEEKKFLKTFDWIGTLLEKISDKTSKLIDKVDKFYNWQKKNAMINRAVKSTDREISTNERAYQAYMKKANSVGLGLNYVRKIQNGTLSIEDITDEKLADKIDLYQEWFDKAQACFDTIEDLYDKQRDLIKQKLDNVLDYYSDMDSYLSSITSKIESIISLNDEMGKRSSLTELVEQFASISDQLETATTKNVAGVTITEGSLGGSKKVADAVNRDRQELADSIKSEIDNLDVKESGTYTKLLNNIAKTQVEIDKYENKGWDKTKTKSYEKLQKKLQDYYDLQKALDENATSDTIANYEKTYTALQKLQNKIDDGKQLSKSEQKRFDTYTKQLEGLKTQGQAALDKLYGELAEADGTAPSQSESDRIKDEINGIQSGLEDTATYKNLLKTIEDTKSRLAKLDEKGYENLTGKQKKTYDKLRIQLEDYYDQKKSLDENATASNIAEYNKIYLEWKKLQDKIDGGKNLSENQWKQYNDYTKQLENFADEKADTISKLNDALGEALNPSDKLGQIEKTYEESAEGIYDSYQNQIDGIKGEAENAKQYQNILAKAQKLEQKKDTKGLTKSEQANLDKYNAELEAMQKGATGANISDYIKTWESWYKLQQKLDKGTKLSDSEAKNYDTYKAKLEAWNNEKQTRINDLLSQMEDDLEQLQKTYTENVSEAESEVNDYYANLYSLAKQIAEYNISTLQAQLDYLDAYISYYKELVSLYDSFSGDKLTKLLTDLGENTLADKAEAYEGYLKTLQDKYNTTMSEMNEYSQLLDALDTNDFQSSMELFDKALESYRASGDTAMAEKLQSVLDLLNERAVDADNWGEFADQWAEEWEKEFAAAKQELIGTATEIQEVNDALRQIRFDNITDAINGLDTAKGILSSIADLINDDWMYDNGELSEYGRAKVALLVSQLEDSQKKANAYLDLMNEIQNSKDTYASDKAYMDDLNNATQNYYNTLGETASLENSIVEIMKRGAQEEIDSLKKIIDARKKALQTKKEYYDYDKSLKNSQKEIDSIKAQIAALEGLSDATDAATKAKLAQLKADLAEKEDALQETKDEHTYNLQIDALDEFVASLEDTLNSSTQTVAEIMEEYQKAINDATDIYRTSTDSVNDMLDKLIAFYSGMGTSIDGLDLTPNGTGVTDGKVLTVNTSVAGDSKVADAINMTTDAVGRTADITENLSEYLQEKLNGGIDVVDSQNTEILGQINDNTSKTAELLEKYGIVPVSPDKLWENFKFNPIDVTARQYETMVNTKPYVPQSIINREMQPNITIHYDNMINVEGSVDKSFSREFQENSKDIYKGVVNQLAKDLKHNGVNFVRRPTLPTIS